MFSPRRAGLLINIAGGSGRRNGPLECAAKMPRRLGLTQIQVAGHFIPVMIGSAEALERASVTGRLLRAVLLPWEPMAANVPRCLRGSVCKTPGCLPSQLNLIEIELPASLLM